MRCISAALVLSALATFGQATQTRTYSFAYTSSNQEFQDLASIVRTAAGINPTIYTKSSFTVSAPAERIGIADWLFQELDQPPVRAGHPDPRQYMVSHDDIVRISYLPPSQTVQEFQEAVGSIRALGPIRMVWGENVRRALVIRGSAAEVAFAAWLLDDIEQPAQGTRSHEYQIASDDQARVFRLSRQTSVRDLQELAFAIHAMVDTHTLFALGGPHAVVVRGTPGQITVAAWLVDQLEQPHTAPAAASFVAGADDELKIFYFPTSLPLREFVEKISSIQSATVIPRAMTIETPRAFAARGSSSQIAQAERLVRDALR
jgi:hypothetical protein